MIQDEDKKMKIYSCEVYEVGVIYGEKQNEVNVKRNQYLVILHSTCTFLSSYGICCGFAFI